MLKNLNYANIGFRYPYVPYEAPAQLASIGWEHETSSLYYWDGLKRMEKDCFLMQYTLSGEGAIRLDGQQTYALKQGQAFFVELPGNHCYYLPEHSTQWEFIFVVLYGDEVRKTWNRLIRQFGPIQTFELEEPIIQKLFAMFRKASHKRIVDAYQAAGMAFHLLMELYRAQQSRKNVIDFPKEIYQTIQFIKDHYNKELTVAQIAESARLSKYYFIRLFQSYTGLTPHQYVTKLRMEKAIELLHTKGMNVNEIAEHVGFSNGNYFIKVFRKMVGVTPSQFRHGTATASFDRISFH